MKVLGDSVIFSRGRPRITLVRRSSAVEVIVGAPHKKPWRFLFQPTGVLFVDENGEYAAAMDGGVSDEGERSAYDNL